MVKFSTLAFAASAMAAPSLHERDVCPELPGNPVLGPAVPEVPANIPTGCSAYEVLVARGTSEPDFAPDGKFGVIVGDPIVSNLTQVLPGVQGYPVQYPASSDFENSIAVGAQDVANRLAYASDACPDQVFALVGYSQGALVMHYASYLLPEALFSKIKSISVFGDPALKASPVGWPYGLGGKVRSVCIDGDLYCDPDGDCLYDHLRYIEPAYIDAAVDAIAESLQGPSIER